MDCIRNHWKKILTVPSVVFQSLDVSYLLFIATASLCFIYVIECTATFPTAFQRFCKRGGAGSVGFRMSQYATHSFQQDYLNIIYCYPLCRYLTITFWHRPNFTFPGSNFNVLVRTRTNACRLCLRPNEVRCLSKENESSQKRVFR